MPFKVQGASKWLVSMDGRQVWKADNWVYSGVAGPLMRPIE